MRTPSAEAHLNRRGGVTLNRKVLTLTDPARDADIKRLIQGAALGGVGKSISTGGLVTLPAERCQPADLLVCPLSPTFLGPTASEPVAMIFIGDSQSERRMPRTVLAKLYG